MRDESVNIAPPPACAKDTKSPLWEEFRAGRGAGWFEVVERPGQPSALRISSFTNNPAWRSVPRKIEPLKEYRLEAQIRGSGRLMLQWIRLEKRWDSMKEGRSRLVEVPLGEVCSSEVSDDSWNDAAVGEVAPREATHCRIFLEAVGSALAVEFREVFLDGLGRDSLAIHYCHAGYHPRASKTAIIQLKEQAKGGRFILIDENGRQRFEGDMELIEKPAWGRSFRLADFSQFQEEGNFALAVEVGGRRLRTKFFPIRDDIYTRLSELTLDWFGTQRCGTAVPGWHERCHADDGAVRNKGEVRKFCDATGGWHDGGSYAKLTQHIWIAIHSLTHLHERGGGREDDARAGHPIALEECRWGVEYLLKIATSDGRFASSVIGRREQEYIGPPEEETDNVPESGDERTVEPECSWTAAALCSYALANYARVVEKMFPSLAKRCYAAAERTFAALEKSKAPDDPINLHAAAALLCISLWRARGKEQYREECSWRALSILQKQTDEGIFAAGEQYRRRLALPAGERIRLPDMTDPDTGMEYAPAPFLYLHALLCYLERSIDDALALEIRGALDKFFVRIKQCTDVSPFGQMGEWTLADDAVSFPSMPRGNNTYLLACSYMLAKASALLNRRDLANTAQRQLEWVLGRNIRGACMVCGAGHKELGAYYTLYAAIEEHANGYQPGGVVNGITGGDGRELPLNFPCLDIRSPKEARSGLDVDPRTNQYWMPNCAWFILACGEITKMHNANT
jgi:hypothetical protein